MVRMFVRHPVSDFASWKAEYDSFKPTGRSMGVQGEAVFQSVDDPNDVTVSHDFPDLATARAFAQSDDLREAMGRAGVAAEPSIWFTNPA